MKKTIVILLVISTLLTALPYSNSAQAFFSPPGVPQVVHDPIHTSTNAGGWLKDIALKVLEQARRAALATLKKRVVDVMVDQTIAWIQGGGNPKFVTDFGGFLEDAAQAAAGDVALEVGLGQLCTGINPARIRVQLETPVFSQRVSCTLDDIVGNISRFGQNFTSGGFIAYQELLKPANNRWGIEILTLNELEKRTAQKQDALKQEISAGSGFLSTTQCLEWTLYGNFNGRTEVVGVKAVNESFDFRNPSNPPPVAEGGEFTGQVWRCTKSQVSTPGRVVADTVQNALNLHSNFIVSAEDLTGYAAAIIDAGINRLIKEGFEGILGVPVSAPPTGFASGNIPSSVTEAAGDYTGVQNEQNESQVNREEVVRMFDDAEQALRNASSTYGATLQENNFASSTAASLVDWCNASTGSGTNASQSPESCERAQEIQSNTQENENIFTQNLEFISGLFTELDSLRTPVQNFPTDPVEVSALVRRLTDLNRRAVEWFEVAKIHNSSTLDLLEEIGRLFRACTIDNDATQCP